MNKVLVVGNVSSAITEMLEGVGYEIIYYDDCPKKILGMEFNMVCIDEYDKVCIDAYNKVCIDEYDKERINGRLHETRK